MEQAAQGSRAVGSQRRRAGLLRAKGPAPAPQPVLPTVLSHYRGYGIPVARHAAPRGLNRGRLWPDQPAPVSHRGTADAAAQQLSTGGPGHAARVGR